MKIMIFYNFEQLTITNDWNEELNVWIFIDNHTKNPIVNLSFRFITRWRPTITVFEWKQCLGVGRWGGRGESETHHNEGVRKGNNGWGRGGRVDEQHLVTGGAELGEGGRLVNFMWNVIEMRGELFPKPHTWFSLKVTVKRANTDCFWEHTYTRKQTLAITCSHKKIFN